MLAIVLCCSRNTNVCDPDGRRDMWSSRLMRLCRQAMLHLRLLTNSLAPKRIFLLLPSDLYLLTGKLAS